uniref:Uncharacterized protein n=1 Tax=Rhizophora mucronata TaxID=61149 RepID=A0A2P2R4W1_RHIMU
MTLLSALMYIEICSVNVIYFNCLESKLPQSLVITLLDYLVQLG